MWRGNAFVRICLSVCLFVCNASSFESLDLDSSFSVRSYIFRIFSSSSHIKVIGSRSRSQSKRANKREISFFHPPSVTDMAQYRCSCSDDKSISVIRGMTLSAGRPRNRTSNFRSADRQTVWWHVVSVFCSRTLCLRLKGSLVLYMYTHWRI